MSVLEKAKDLTEEEKAKLVCGASNMGTHGVERLGIPSLRFSDGPLGVRKINPEAKNGSDVDATLPSTCFPVGANLGNTWSTELLGKMGRALGKEAKYYDVDILLGPGINIKRNPLNGRNFEYYSEDPFLTGALASSYIKGLQSEGVGACAKHFALNNNESFRFVSDSLADERTMREIYLKAFEKVMKEARPWAVMTAYNRVNSEFCSQSSFLLDGVLRKEWGYDGLAMSDWGGTQDRVLSLRNGLDLEMPGCIPENVKEVEKSVKTDSLLKKKEEESVGRILSAIDKASLTDRSKKDPSVFEEGDKTAYELALESLVLLKNGKDALPLKKDGKVLVLGSLFEEEHYQGGGSSMIHAYRTRTLKEAFEEKGISFDYEKGYSEEDGKPDAKLEEKALKKAEEYDTVLLFLGERGTDDSEGYDRDSLLLPENQVSLLKKLPSDKKIVVLLYGGGTSEIPCLDKISALIYCGLYGQEGGRALVSVLTGETSPSGKLAESFYASYGDVPYGKEFVPGTEYLYKEGLFVGYREPEGHPKKFLFPFGYGMSYTEFAYSDLSLAKEEKGIRVSYTVTNTGKAAGKEVSEVYVGKKDSSFLRPRAELKGFSKDALLPGEKKRISVFIPYEDMKVYSVRKKAWTLEGGKYEIYVGKDSASFPLRGDVQIEGENIEPETEADLAEKYESYSLNEEEFFRLLGKKEKKETYGRPYTMETPIAYFSSPFGKFFRKIVVGVGKKKVKSAKKIQDPEAKARRIKSGTFVARLMPYNSLRSLSFSSSGAFPYRVAKGILEMANGHFIRGLRRMSKKEKD